MFRFLALFGGLSLFTSAMAQQTIWEVLVSDSTGDLSYSPQQVTAEVGDTVRFIFEHGTHSATQSSLENPCTPISNGFDSKFVSAPSDGSPNPSFEVTVNDTNPIYVYCRVNTGNPLSHCRQGMVMAINDGGTFGLFKVNAFDSHI